MFCLHSFNKGDTLLHIRPERMIQDVNRKIQGLDTYAQFACFLLDTDDWCWYIETLPSIESFNHMLLNLTIDEINCIPDISVRRAVKSQIDSIDSNFALMSHLYPFETFKWAYLCVYTRCLAVSSSRFAMVPGFDMLNHASNGIQSTSITIGSSGVVITAPKKFEKDEQVFICYGQYSDIELLLHYGFIEGKDNMFNCVRFDELVSLLVDKNGWIIPLLITNHFYPIQDICITITPESRWKLMVYLRVIAMGKGARIPSAVFHGEVEILSKSNEAKAKSMLIELVHQKIQSYSLLQAQTRSDLLRIHAINQIQLLESILIHG